jgi:hypothetical protein
LNIEEVKKCFDSEVLQHLSDDNLFQIYEQLHSLAEVIVAHSLKK